MQVLIVDNEIDRQAEITIALMRSGFQATSTGCLNVAETCIRRGIVDLLVMTERVNRRLTHSLALLAEYRNPMVATMLLTPRTDDDVDELFLLLPSLHCLIAPDSPARLIAKLAVAAVSGAVRAEGPIILPPSMRVETPGIAPIFASARSLAPPVRYTEISHVA